MQNSYSRLISSVSIFGPVEKYVLLYRFPVQMELHENYQKKSMRNRTMILSANGLQRLSIPLKKGKTQSHIAEVEISYDDNWTKDYLQGIRSCYGNAPFFDFYYQEVYDLIKRRYDKLMDICLDSQKMVCNFLGIPEFGFTDRFEKHHPDALDIRYVHPARFVRLQKYNQVFEDKFGFVKKLSILDLLFNLGPEATTVLKSSEIIIEKGEDAIDS